VRRLPEYPVEANITPAYCGCQEATTTYCYYTPTGSILPVIVGQVNATFQPLDSRTIDPVSSGFNAHYWCIDVEGCGFGGKAGYIRSVVSAATVIFPFSCGAVLKPHHVHA